MSDFDISLCDQFPDSARRRICRGEIGTEKQVDKFRKESLRLMRSNRGNAVTLFANEQYGLPLNGGTVSAPHAVSPDRPDNLPVLIDGGRSPRRVNPLASNSNQQAADGSGKSVSHSVSPSGCKNCDKVQTMSLYDRFTSFVKTQAKTLVSGFADDETIKARLAICESCPHLKKNHCELCGCKCNGGANFMNKLGHKSSVCPDNPPRWGAAE